MLGALASSVPGAQAHGPDTSGWVEQAGNGRSESKPTISNMEIGAVLYDARRFMNGPLVNPQVPSQPTTHIAFGTRPTAGGKQLFLLRGGNDGLSWGAPIATTLRDPDGQDIPFVIGDPGSFDVEYLPGFINIVYRIWYTEPGAAGTTAASILIAGSMDGILWTLDGAIAESAAGSVVGGTGFKSRVIGPSDVHYLKSSATAAACGANPWDCATVMVYTTADPSGKQYASLAWSTSSGATFTGLAAPILSPGGSGAWDDSADMNLTVEKLNSTTYGALYSGKQTGGASSIGWATSANGVAFTKSATNPATPGSLFDAAATPSGTGSLVKAQFLKDGSSEHTRVYTSRTVGGVGHSYVGATAPAPGTAPHVRVSSPAEGDIIGPKVPVTIFAGDTLGTPPGLDMSTLSVTIDGIGGLALTSEDTIVGQYKLPGKKIVSASTLADGPHTLVASIKDVEGNATTVTVNFNVDGQAPNSTITSSPAGPEIGFPDSIGKFAATVTDAGGTGIEFVSAVVTNPLGQVKAWTTHAPSGWQVTKGGPNIWTVVWIAPTYDPHFAAPGEYFVSIQGTDGGGLREKQDVANTASVLVI